MTIDYFCLFVLCDEQTIDFLDKLLRYDHQDRLTAKEAMVISLLLSRARSPPIRIILIV